MPDQNDFSPLNWKIADLLRGRRQQPQYKRADPGKSASGQRAFSFLQTDRAQFAVRIQEACRSDLLGDPKIAAMKVLQ